MSPVDAARVGEEKHGDVLPKVVKMSLLGIFLTASIEDSRSYPGEWSGLNAMQKCWVGQPRATWRKYANERLLVPAS